MTANAAENTVDALISRVGACTSSNTFAVGPLDLPDTIPNLAVFCRVVVPGIGTPFMSSTRKKDLWETVVQVMTRGEPNEVKAARDLAKSCRDALHRNPPSADFFFALVDRGDPTWIGLDDAERPRFVFDLDLRYVHTIT